MGCPVQDGGATASRDGAAWYPRGSTDGTGSFRTHPLPCAPCVVLLRRGCASARSAGRTPCLAHRCRAIVPGSFPPASRSCQCMRPALMPCSMAPEIGPAAGCARRRRAQAPEAGDVLCDIAAGCLVHTRTSRRSETFKNTSSHCARMPNGRGMSGTVQEPLRRPCGSGCPCCGRAGARPSRTLIPHAGKVELGASRGRAGARLRRYQDCRDPPRLCRRIRRRIGSGGDLERAEPRRDRRRRGLSEQGLHVLEAGRRWRERMASAKSGGTIADPGPVASGVPPLYSRSACTCAAGLDLCAAARNRRPPRRLARARPRPLWARQRPARHAPAAARPRHPCTRRPAAPPQAAVPLMRTLAQPPPPALRQACWRLCPAWLGHNCTRTAG